MCVCEYFDFVNMYINVYDLCLYLLSSFLPTSSHYVTLYLTDAFYTEGFSREDKGHLKNLLRSFRTFHLF